jgi:RNA polymerase-binding transcription factor DksA
MRRLLLEPEVEFEETSQKEALSDVAASLDEEEAREVGAIDRALARIEIGDYRVCESCGKPISLRRLEAVPWTTYCARCAKQREGQPSAGAAAGGDAEAASSRSVELPGPEEIEAIFDELREDGGVDTEELRIALHEDRVHLEGFLPTESQRQRLLEVVEDHIGLTDVVGETVISPLSWERPDRAPGTRTIEDVASELAPQEEETGAGPYESRRTGTPLEPADGLEPEEK